MTADDTILNSSIGHFPAGKWQFGADVAQVFDDMLTRSIPAYPLMRSMVFDLAQRAIRSGTTVVDLGSSLGEGIAGLVERFQSRNRYLAIEIAPAMLAHLRERFKVEIARGVVDVREHDLRSGLPTLYAESSVVLSILTLQFVPIEYRPRILSAVYRSLLPGGAFIFVEKILGATWALDKLFVDSYYAMKQSNGYSDDEIERKRLSLEGVLVPLDAGMNETLLRGAGFRQIDCFYRYHNFAGWIALKD